MSVEQPAGWTARPATVADRPDQVRLFNDCFRKQKDEQTLAWKYERNPDGPAIALVGVEAGTARDGRKTVVGAYAYMPRRFLRDGKPVLLMQAADAMTDAAWRGRGVFTGLDRLVASQAGEQGVPLAFAYSGRQSLNGFLRNGWRIIGHAHLYRRRFRYRRALARLPRIGRAAALAAPLLDVVTSLRDRGRLALPGGAAELRRLERFDASVDRLFAGWAPKVGLVGVRDARWLNWRYVDTPAHRHECYGLFRGEELLGYAVAELADGHAWLVDQLAQDGETRATLLKAFTALARQRRMEEASALLFEHDQAVHELERLGWRGPLQRKPFRDIFPFIVRACRTDAPAEDFSMTRWHLADGDRDAEHNAP